MDNFANQNNTNSEKDSAKEKNVVELFTITPKNRIFLNIMITFGVCFIFVMFFFQIIFVPITIDGVSMQPTINNSYNSITHSDERDIVYYLHTNKYQRGDIVIINNALENDKIIKRVIAVGGETIAFNLVPGTERRQFPGNSSIITSMQMEIVITNDSGSTKLEEDYIKEKMYFEFLTELNNDTYGKYEEYVKMNNSLKQNLTYSITLPENTFYCMGDNRNLSKDSRCYSYFTSQDILGEMVLHIPHGRTIFYAIWHGIFG